MFAELVPLLEKNDVILTLAQQKDGCIRVTVLPRPHAPIGTDKGEESDIAQKALSTPLMLEGTPSELEEKFASTLIGYVDVRKELETDLNQALESMRQCKDEIKKLETSERKKLADKRSKTPSKSEESDSSPEKQEVETKPKDETAELFPAIDLSQPKLVTPPAAASTAQ